MTPQLKAQLESALSRLTNHANNCASANGELFTAGKEALAALRAEPVSEPVGVIKPWGVEWSESYSGHKRNEGMKLYAAPQSAVPEPLKLLEMSQDNYVSQFGSDAASNWIYDDLRDLFSQPPKGEAL